MNKGYISYFNTTDDPIPVYFKLQKNIQDEIENGNWKPGSAIPPERELVVTHQVSIGTVKKAILNLVKEGYLIRIQGKGTYVTGTALRRENMRYYRRMTNFGGKESPIKINFLELKKIKAVTLINQQLNIEKKQGLYELRRVFTSKGKPIVYTVSYLPQNLFPNLENFSKSKFEKVPIFISLEESYGLPTIFNRELIGIETPDKQIAKELNVEQTAPLLYIEMLAYTYKQRPYEYRKSYCLSGTQKIFREW